MQDATLRPSAREGNGQSGEPDAGVPRPASFLCDALVALLEDDPARPIRVHEKVYVRASALVPVLIEALDRAKSYYEPQSLSADAIDNILAYTERVA